MPTRAQDFDYEQLRARAMTSLFEAFDSLCEGTVVVDRDARVVWINERYAARFGVADAKTAIGKEIEEIIPTSLMREVVRTGRPLLLDILDVDGESFVVTRIPIKDDNGETIGAIGFALYDKLQPLQPFYARLHRLQHQLAQTQQHLAAERRAKYTFTHYIGNSPAAALVKHQARRAAQLDTTVLLLGETGTGKELLAHAIHAASARADRAFVGFNVAAIPDTLLEAECFGAAPGAYTGADKKARVGKFELANGGTLFLDEIGDMPLAMQAKLLRFLQERVFERVGGRQEIAIDVRIVCATHQDLKELIKAGRFREDLYYRLAEIVTVIPPLRARIGDAVLLANAFARRFAEQHSRGAMVLTADALRAIEVHGWPGNVRELENCIKRAVIMADNTQITADDVGLAAADDNPMAFDLRTIREAAEKTAVLAVMARVNGNIAKAAEMLGVSRPTLYDLMHRFGLK